MYILPFIQMSLPIDLSVIDMCPGVVDCHMIKYTCMYMYMLIRMAQVHGDMLFERGECCDTYENSEEKSGILVIFRKVGQYDLLYTNGAIVQAWYILWGQCK